MSEGPKLVLLRGKSDPKARSQLTSQPLDPAPASAEAVTFPRGEVGEGSFGNWHLKDTGDQGTIAQHGVHQGVYSEILLRSNLLACAWVFAV